MTGPDLKVVKFTGVPGVREILESALEKDLTEVLVIGWSKDGDLCWTASCKGNTGELLHLLEGAKFDLLSQHAGLEPPAD